MLKSIQRSVKSMKTYGFEKLPTLHGAVSSIMLGMPAMPYYRRFLENVVNVIFNHRKGEEGLSCIQSIMKHPSVSGFMYPPEIATSLVGAAGSMVYNFRSLAVSTILFMLFFFGYSIGNAALPKSAKIGSKMTHVIRDSLLSIPSDDATYSQLQYVGVKASTDNVPLIYEGRILVVHRTLFTQDGVAPSVFLSLAAMDVVSSIISDVLTLVSI